MVRDYSRPVFNLTKDRLTRWLCFVLWTGTPTTLGESQAALKATTWGAHITFKQSDAISFYAPSPHPTLESTPSLAILSHCTWYFSSPHLLTQTFLALKKEGIPNLALAEWDISCRPAQPAATALHLHAVLLQSLPAALQNTQANIRCPFTPRAIQQAALEAGWKLRNETVLRSPELEDAQWELYAARAASTDMREAQLTNEDRIALDAHEAVLQAAAAHWEASRPSADALPACLDVWVAWFE